MDPSITVSIISGGGVIVAAFLAFLGNKKGSLATAESEFRKTILAENKDLRERVEKLEVQLEDALQRNRELEFSRIHPVSKQNQTAGIFDKPAVDGG